MPFAQRTILKGERDSEGIHVLLCGCLINGACRVTVSKFAVKLLRIFSRHVGIHCGHDSGPLSRRLPGGPRTREFADRNHGRKCAVEQSSLEEGSFSGSQVANCCEGRLGCTGFSLFSHDHQMLSHKTAHNLSTPTQSRFWCYVSFLTVRCSLSHFLPVVQSYWILLYLLLVYR